MRRLLILVSALLLTYLPADAQQTTTPKKPRRTRAAATAQAPAAAPEGASAKCRDGTYSFSRSRRGTCSHHGGVTQWL